MIGDNFSDCGDYWLSSNPQGSEKWLSDRLGRLTASNFGNAIKDGPFKTRYQTALYVAGMEQEFSEQSKKVMSHGSATEPIARKWYCDNYKVSVEELGLAVPKWDHRIGASVDGNILGSDGIIEIKCPLKMYSYLQKRIEDNKNGKIFDQYDHSHIWDSHYCQMQGCMAILNKKYCDYIVYATETSNVYVERIPFNQNFWDSELYPGINTFFSEIYPKAFEEVSSKLRN